MGQRKRFSVYFHHENRQTSRLNYSANLLTYSEKPVILIKSNTESGFKESLYYEIENRRLAKKVENF